MEFIKFMYAIVDISGKQFKVTPSERIYVPLLEKAVGDSVEFTNVKLISDDADVTVGTPNLNNVTVRATVLEHMKDDKVIVFKKKRRKGYQIWKGHRQNYTQIEINSIETA